MVNLAVAGWTVPAIAVKFLRCFFQFATEPEWKIVACFEEIEDAVMVALRPAVLDEELVKTILQRT